MKTAIVIRHIKSDWSNTVPDFDRPVRTDRVEDAILIASEITKKGSLPQSVISSPSTRTLQTAEVFCDKWHFPYDKIVQDRFLYEGSTKDIITAIRNADTAADTIAIICHNPSITDFVYQYSDKYILNVPTSGAVSISFDVEKWADVSDKGKMNWILRPKELRQQ